MGTWAAVSPQQLARLEAVFAERDTAAVHEVATTADMTVLPMLAARGYQPVEWSAVLCQPLAEHTPPHAPRHTPRHTALQVRRIASHDATHWADTSARGWSDTPELANFMRGFARIAADAHDTHAFLVEREGEAVAAGSLHLNQGVALLAGASTVPAHRGQGAQGALLAERLRFAREQGADVAMLVAAPGSASQRNAQRAGFQVAYSRVKFERAPGGN
jgi:GNAT superfamily N-acetyltransferase